MDQLINTILEKHAGAVGDWFKNLGPVKRYNAIKASPGFKAKKTLGKGILATSAIGGPLAYGAYQVTEPPEREERAPQLQYGQQQMY